VSSTPVFDSREEQFQLLRRLLAHRPFRRMLAREGIDLQDSWWRGSEEMILRALARCAACAGSGACRAWLEEVHPPGTYPSFCPNSAVIEACRALEREARLLRAGKEADQSAHQPPWGPTSIVKRPTKHDQAGVIAALRTMLRRGR
jgi:hypothetical protein